MHSSSHDFSSFPLKVLFGLVESCLNLGLQFCIHCPGVLCAEKVRAAIDFRSPQLCGEKCLREPHSRSQDVWQGCAAVRPWCQVWNAPVAWTAHRDGLWHSQGAGIYLQAVVLGWETSWIHEWHPRWFMMIYVLRLKHLQRIDVSHRCWPLNNQRHNLQHLTDCHTYFPAFSSLFQIPVDDQSRRKCSGIVWVLTFLFEDQELEHLETFIILTKGFASRCELKWVDSSWICGHVPFVTVPWMLV